MSGRADSPRIDRRQSSTWTPIERSYERDGQRDSPFSIVIDNYNYAEFLARAIKSALDQSYRPLEVIVVDDGSTDESVEVAKAFGDQVKLVRKANGGQGSAINAGFAASVGNVVVFLDADDELHERAIAQVAAAMTSETAKVHWRLEEVDESGTSLNRTNPPQTMALHEGDCSQRLLTVGRYNSPVMSGNAYPRWVLERILPMPEAEFKQTADGYLVTVAGLLGPIVALPGIWGSYRRHGRNAWAAAELDIGSLSRHVQREMARYRELRRTASALGMRPDDRIEYKDQTGLRSRLASARLNPGGHPVPGDRPAILALAGVRSCMGDSDLSLRRRVVFALWFLLVALAPYRFARRLVAWLYIPASRPWTAKRFPTALSDGQAGRARPSPGSRT